MAGGSSPIYLYKEFGSALAHARACWLSGIGLKDKGYIYVRGVRKHECNVEVRTTKFNCFRNAPFLQILMTCRHECALTVDLRSVASVLA